MAHFAQLDDQNVVLQVIVVNDNDCKDENGNESEEVGVAFCKSLFGENTRWKQTSYNARIRKNYAGIGYKYDEYRDGFVPPQPHRGWFINFDTCQWYPPVPMPDDGKFYSWDDSTLSWVEVAP